MLPVSSGGSFFTNESKLTTGIADVAFPPIRLFQSLLCDSVVSDISSPRDMDIAISGALLSLIGYSDSILPLRTICSQVFVESLAPNSPCLSLSLSSLSFFFYFASLSAFSNSSSKLRLQSLRLSSSQLRRFDGSFGRLEDWLLDPSARVIHLLFDVTGTVLGMRRSLTPGVPADNTSELQAWLQATLEP